MSHQTTIQDIQVTDLDALAEACKDLGLQLTKGKARGYYGATVKCDHVIRLRGPYDVAVHRQADGTYSLSADLWRGHVERELGPGLQKLKQRYAYRKLVKEAKKKGFTVRTKTERDGTIKLTLSAWR